MGDGLKMLIGGGLLTVVYSLVQLILNRIWSKKDEKNGLKRALIELEKKLDDHIAEQELSSMKQARIRIIRLADDIRRGVPVSHEMLDNGIDDVDTYLAFCDSHPNFQNNKARLSIALVKDAYMSSQRGGEV